MESSTRIEGGLPAYTAGTATMMRGARSKQREAHNQPLRTNFAPDEGRVMKDA